MAVNNTLTSTGKGLGYTNIAPVDVDAMKLAAEVVQTYSSLGQIFDDEYMPSRDCVGCLKDLIYFLRVDSEAHTVRSQLGNAGIFKSDLIPLLADHWDNEELVVLLIRLLVNLTTPPLLLFDEEAPKDPERRHCFNLLVEIHQKYKEDSISEGFWMSLCRVMLKFCNLSVDDLSEDRKLTIERILIIIRNILHAPSDARFEDRTDDDANVHDQVLWQLYRSGMNDALLFILTSEDHECYYLHSLEIVSLILREQEASKLAKTDTSDDTHAKAQEELLKIQERERLQTKLKNMRTYKTRHTNFGGTYWIQNSASDERQPLTYHKPVGNFSKVTLDDQKFDKKVRIDRRPLEEPPTARLSTFSVRFCLKEFSSEFICGGYNTVMKYIKGQLVRGQTQKDDESYYFWAMQFFMEFNRSAPGSSLKYISETMNIETFHYIQTQLFEQYDLMIADKKKLTLHSKRMHLSVRAYKELLQTLVWMIQSRDMNKTAIVLANRIFYVQEHRDMWIILLQQYTEIKFSKTYLKDIVEATHIFVLILENLSVRNTTLVVQAVKKKRKHKKKKSSSHPVRMESDIGSLWDKLSCHVISKLNDGSIMELEMLPINLHAEEDEQKAGIMKQIQSLLRDEQVEHALQMVKSARAYWPENDMFGALDVTPSDELTLVRELFFAKLPGSELEPIPQESETIAAQVSEEEEESDDETAASNTREENLNFSEYIIRFASAKIIQNYMILYKRYRENTSNTNMCVTKMLHRIAYDCDLSSLLFYGSFFKIFINIMQDSRDLNHVPELKEMARFAKFITKKFIEVARDKELIYLELFFQKKRSDAVRITHGGDGTSNTGKIKGKLPAAVWTEHEEYEVERLYDQFKHEAGNGKDIVDDIISGMTDSKKTRNQIIKKLKNLNLITAAKDIRRATVGKNNWPEADIEQLQELYEKYKDDATDPVTLIVNELTGKRSKRTVIKKLLELGVVSDHKDLKKKSTGRKSMAQKSNKPGQLQADDDVSIYDDWSDEDDDVENRDEEHNKSIGSNSGKSNNREINSDSEIEDDPKPVAMKSKSSNREITKEGNETSSNIPSPMGRPDDTSNSESDVNNSKINDVESTQDSSSQSSGSTRKSTQNNISQSRNTQKSKSTQNSSQSSRSTQNSIPQSGRSTQKSKSTQNRSQSSRSTQKSDRCKSSSDSESSSTTSDNCTPDKRTQKTKTIPSNKDSVAKTSKRNGQKPKNANTGTDSDSSDDDPPITITRKKKSSKPQNQKTSNDSGDNKQKKKCTSGSDSDSNNEDTPVTIIRKRKSKSSPRIPSTEDSVDNQKKSNGKLGSEPDGSQTDDDTPRKITRKRKSPTSRHEDSVNVSDSSKEDEDSFGKKKRRVCAIFDEDSD